MQEKTFFKRISLFDEFPYTIASTILYILKLWIFESKNAAEIPSKIINDYQNLIISKQKILEILNYMRNIIAYYLKDIYKIEDIWEPNAMDKFAIDESLFINYKNTPYWVMGIINVTTRAIRLEISPIIDVETLKSIIITHINIGNVIISDNWAGYHWLNNPINGYIHHVHSHGHGDFGIGTDSTSHIEQLWVD